MLDGKVALISGAARGLGAAHARVFVEQGASVVVGDVLDGTPVAAELGDRASSCSLDVSDEASWAAAVGHTLERFGRIDVLVNNAAICPVAPLLETPPDLYRRVVAVNQVGVLLGIQAVAPAMAQQGGGVIINIGSIDGLRGVPNLVAYSSAKYAVRGITRTAALELAPMRVRVNVIHPGGIDTAMFEEAGSELLRRSGIADASGPMLAKMLEGVVPVGRISQPEEVARFTAFIASDAGAYINGAELVFDGGLTAGASS